MSGIVSKIAVRAYLAAMSCEGMWALGLRRSLLGLITGQRPPALNIFAQVYIEGFEGLRLGRDVSINRNSNLSAYGGLTIGDNVAIGHGTSILTTNHGYSASDIPIKYQPVTLASVKIGNNVWIGANVTILAGVSVADGCVIAAGAVVTKSIETPNQIVAGVPARAIKSRFG